MMEQRCVAVFVFLWASGMVAAQGTSLFFVRKESAIPVEVLDYLKKELPLTVVEITCSPTDPGDMCSMLRQHEAVVSRRGAKGMVGVGPWAELGDDYITRVIEHVLGDSITHIDSHSSLISFLSVNQHCLLALIPGSTNTPEYLSLLRSFMINSPQIPLIVTRSKDTLPLSRRPKHLSKGPPLYVYNLRGSGEQWYQLHHLHLIDNFIFRSQYPVIVNLDEEESVIKEFQKKNMHLLLFFPGLLGSDHHDMRQLAEMITEKLYLWCIVVLADRIHNSEVAKRYSITDDLVAPQIVLLLNGVEDKMVFFGVGGENLEIESANIIYGLLPYMKEDNVVGGEVDEADEGMENLPSVSVTNLDGIDLLINRTKRNLVVAFCKKGNEMCPDEIYYSLESVQIRFSKAHLDVSYHFQVVECDSVEDILKYGINSLPSYALYNGTKRSWKQGTGNVKYYRDILSMLAEENSHEELKTTQPEGDNNYYGEFEAYPRALLDPTMEDNDIYARLVSTLPHPSLPAELVLTDENFKQRIGKSEKTAVLFYLQWSVESKLVLHHLLGAWEQLPDSSKEKATLASMDCHSYTQTCSHFNLTSLPCLLIFTSSKPDTPAPPPPFVGVLDSARLLLALQEVSQDPQELRELTPASLPVLIGKKLTTPLVVWCDNNPVSKLAHAFTDVARLTFADSPFSFCWINSSERLSLLDSAFGVTAASLPTVLTLRLDEGAVYQMGVIGDLQPDAFREQLVTFLNGIQEGIKPTGTLTSRKWPPLQSPIPFPSVTAEQQAARGEEFDDIGEMDLESFPRDQSPQVLDTLAFEDQSHEVGVKVKNREEL